MTVHGELYAFSLIEIPLRCLIMENYALHSDGAGSSLQTCIKLGAGSCMHAWHCDGARDGDPVHQLDLCVILMRYRCIYVPFILDSLRIPNFDIYLTYKFYYKL